jgi:hypothetical protein
MYSYDQISKQRVKHDLVHQRKTVGQARNLCNLSNNTVATTIENRMNCRPDAMKLVSRR